MLESKDIKSNRVYRAKKPKRARSGFINDRVVLWIGIDEVQYDSPSVRMGSHLPMMSMVAFLKWADRDVTDELPKGQWAEEL